jgi:glycosyltransferase involved in cell wall biosynthesis/peptidoglycan/xylan/chitin deacetylase (PgdA/CDA1 family)
MRLLFLSNIYPTPVDPAKGIFNHHLLASLSQGHQIQVVAPIPWIDECTYRRKQGLWLRAIQRSRWLDGIEVSHPRYYYPPRLLRNQYSWFYWFSVRSTLLPMFRREKPDVVLSHWAHPDGEAALWAARRADAPVVIIVGGSEVHQLAKQSRRRRCIARVLQEADAVIAVSEDLKSQLIGWGIAAEKLHVVPRGVDSDLFTPGNQSEARRRLGIAVEGNVLVWVGRMVPVKGLDVLLQACTRLVESVIPFRLYLVGKGPLEHELRQSCQSLGLMDRVFFPGPCSHQELGDWYRAADWTVLPSRAEGIPNVLRESLSCGTPFVASNVGGIPELACYGPNRLVPPEDAAALADALAAALTEPRRLAVPLSVLPTWKDSANALEGVIRNVMRVKKTDGKPVPYGRGSAWRQFLRRGMTAVMPRRLFLSRGPAAEASVALTFDDGPHPEHTARLLDILGELQWLATFFVIGEQAKRYPHLVQRMAAEGHVIGSHSYYCHNGPPKPRPFRETVEDIRQTRDLLTDILGVPVRLFRPPYGKLTARLAWWLWRSGYTIALWNVDPKDYACVSADEVRSWFARHPWTAGDVVLMHDNHPYAAAVLPDLAAALRRQQLTPVSLAAWVKPYEKPSCDRKGRIDIPAL